eukprot:TRINITY_DN95_c0_g1_i2.p1 TRINITY_DN95_c0_g1~~TRINITY_DN95_c0_g1_i2.p1  ORF type:complete len:219 (-),score=43.35 TRINITY_DN95_c0_g1_i2:195-851(-)
MLRGVASRAVGIARIFARCEHTLPELKYPIEKGIPPVFTAKQLDLHYNKHHQSYVTNLNNLVTGTEYETHDVVETIMESAEDPAGLAIFNNASQHFNHCFFWDCMIPSGTTVPQTLKEKIEADFGSLEKFQDKFTATAATLFGSGWVWLTQNRRNKKLDIVATKNAGSPLTQNLYPLLTLDVWEHSYYLDHQNRRAEYINQWWKVVNWRFVEEQLARR